MKRDFKKEILCTLGPASLNDRTIACLEELGVTLFRINLSHTKLHDLEATIRYIQRRTKIPICLDTEGAQIRTGELTGQEICVEEESTLDAYRNQGPAGPDKLSFYPPSIVDELILGDLISIDFHSVLVKVIEKDKEKIAMRVLSGGRIGQNKAVTVERDMVLPVLTQKDEEALKRGTQMGIRHVALSFANRASDVDLLRSFCPPGTFVISKIECRNGVKNLQEIAVKSDALLIDRGDLSREEPIERIPKLQKMIIRSAKTLRKKVYVATNLLESMVTSKTPTRAEVNDVYNTLLDGADGLVLAAETAIGKNPIECASMIVKLIHEFESESDTQLPDDSEDVKPLLAAPQEISVATDPATKEMVRELCVSGDCDLETALLRLNKTGFGALFVVDEKNRMVGLVTDRDLRKAVLSRLDLSTPVNHVMNKDFISGRAEDSREELMSLLRKMRRRQLPVLDKEGVVVDVVLIDELYYGSGILVREYR